MVQTLLMHSTAYPSTLIDNMIRMGIDANITSCIATCLDRFTIKHGDKTTKNGGGVPQGCPLSMTSFAIGPSHLIRNIEERVSEYMHTLTTWHLLQTAWKT